MDYMVPSQEGMRIAPKLPVQAVQTFQVVSPLATHWRAATCEEVACEQHANGWRVRVEGLSAADLHTARHCGRAFAEQRVAEGETWLVYPAGQPCFRASQHRVPVGRPELYFVRDGDWRGNPRGTAPRQHTRPEHWVEEFGEHQQRIADEIEKG
jgi:hypothetical protein